MLTATAISSVAWGESSVIIVGDDSAAAKRLVAELAAIGVTAEVRTAPSALEKGDRHVVFVGSHWVALYRKQGADLQLQLRAPAPTSETDIVRVAERLRIQLMELREQPEDVGPAAESHESAERTPARARTTATHEPEVSRAAKTTSTQTGVAGHGAVVARFDLGDVAATMAVQTQARWDAVVLGLRLELPVSPQRIHVPEGSASLRASTLGPILGWRVGDPARLGALQLQLSTALAWVQVQGLANPPYEGQDDSRFTGLGGIQLLALRDLGPVRWLLGGSLEVAYPTLELRFADQRRRSWARPSAAVWLGAEL